MADERVDPRYDPVFQRGYTPGTSSPGRRAAEDRTEPPAPYIAPLSGRDGAGRPLAGAGLSAASASASTSPAAPGAALPSASPSRAEREEAARAQLRASAEAASTASAAPAATADDAVPRRDIRRNPFLWAVVVIGALLIVAGIGLLQDLGRQLTDTGTGTGANYLQLQFEMTGGPMAIALGIAAIVAVILVHGVEWQRGR